MLSYLVEPLADISVEGYEGGVTLLPLTRKLPKERRVKKS